MRVDLVIRGLMQAILRELRALREDVATLKELAMSNPAGRAAFIQKQKP